MKKQFVMFSLFAITAFCFNGNAQDTLGASAGVEASGEDNEEGLREVKEVVVAPVLEHKVSTGETVLMIARRYMLLPKDIYDFNPAAVHGLTSNMVLKLPADKMKKKLKPEQENLITQQQIEIVRKYD